MSFCQVLAFYAENDVFFFFPRKPQGILHVAEQLLGTVPEVKTNVLTQR